MAWTVFVLSIHVVWSISTSILIAEGWAAEQRTTPWLGRIGLTIVAILFIAGCALTTVFTMRLALIGWALLPNRHAAERPRLDLQPGLS